MEGAAGGVREGIHKWGARYPMYFSPLRTASLLSVRIGASRWHAKLTQAQSHTHP